MSNILITSDEHYGHEKIIQYCKRPFASLEEMRETIIERHNQKVPNNPNYVTIHVGDMFWHTLTKEEAFTIISRLHGQHAFIFGNHDELVERNLDQFKLRFLSVTGSNKASGTILLNHNKHKITVNHFAHHVWNQSHRGSWMLFGHSHGDLQVKGKSFDIGVDSHYFEPWSLEEIEIEMEKRPQGHIITEDNLWPGKTLSNTNAGSEVI